MNKARYTVKGSTNGTLLKSFLQYEGKNSYEEKQRCKQEKILSWKSKNNI